MTIIKIRLEKEIWKTLRQKKSAWLTRHNIIDMEYLIPVQQI